MEVPFARQHVELEVGEGGKQKMLLANGKLKDFVACNACVKRVPRKGIIIDRDAARLLGVKAGDELLAVPR